MRTLLIALVCVIIPCHIWAQDMLGEGAIIDKGNNLDENTQALEDVAAAGAADPVKRKVDRIVFDAQTIAADNLNLYDILLATPSVVATEEDISIAGKGRALVLIDDKESRLSGKELITTLKSYNSKDIDKIEMITTPPLKYDVEGSAGVINIRLKRRVGEYLGGSIYDAKSLSKYNLNEYSAVLNYKKGKVLANFTLAGRVGERGEEKIYKRHFPKYYWESRNQQITNSLYVTPKLSLDVELPRNYSIGMILSYLYVNPDYYNKNQTVASNSNAPFEAINGETNYDIDIDHYDANFHVEKRLDSSDKRITFDADVFGRESTIISTHESDTWLNYYSPQARDITNYSTRLDAYLPYERVVLNVGAKYSGSQIVLDYPDNNPESTVDDDMRYREHVATLYGDANFDLSPKFKLKLGLRLEYTNSEANSYMTEEYKKRDYLGLFPTANLGYAPSDKHTHSLTLARRLNRPSFSSLIPNLRWEYEYAQSVGNACLDPAYSYAASYGYTYKNNLSFELSYQYSDDVFGEKMTMNPQTHTTIYKWMNFKQEHVVMASNSYTFNKWRWLQSHLQQGVYWTKSMADNEPTEYYRDGWSYYLSLRNVFYFNKSKTFTGELSFNYRTTTYAANEVAMPRYDLNAGLRRLFLNKRLILALNVDNILASHDRGTMYDGELYTTYDHFARYRTYRLSLTWCFGGSITPKGHVAGNAEEKGRL